jgi:hypothetical protein
VDRLLNSKIFTSVTNCDEKGSFNYIKYYISQKGEKRKIPSKD